MKSKAQLWFPKERITLIRNTFWTHLWGYNIRDRIQKILVNHILYLYKDTNPAEERLCQKATGCRGTFNRSRDRREKPTVNQETGCGGKITRDILQNIHRSLTGKN